MSLFENSVNLMTQVADAYGAGRYARTAASLIKRGKDAMSRPPRKERQAARKRKNPLTHRLSKAAAVADHRMTQVIADPGSPDATVTIAHEVGHLNTRVLKGFEDLGDAGFLDTKDFWKNLRRGSMFVNGAYVSAYTLLGALVLLKGSRLYEEIDNKAGLADRLMPKTPPIKVATGLRAVSADADRAPQPNDLFGYVPPSADGGPARSVRVDEIASWPVGTMVFTGTAPHIAPDWKTVAKLAASIFAVSRDQWYIKLAALFSEELGEMVGAGKGIDFVR